MSLKVMGGKVTEELLRLICKQVGDHGIVVWYDPERSYGEVASALSLPNTRVLRYTDSFFKLRYQLEPFLEFVTEDNTFAPQAEVPPKLLVYIPLERLDTHYALAEVEAAGIVLEPGANPWQRNTRLKVLAERVAQCRSIEGQAERKIYPDRQDQGPLPEVIREDMAFLDRIHYYLPGWEILRLEMVEGLHMR